MKHWYFLLPDAQKGIYIFLICLLGCFSILLQVPGGMFELPAFQAFAHAGTEGQWSYVLGFTAILGIAGYYSRSSMFRTSSIFLLATMHGVIARFLYLATAAGQILSIGFVTYAFIAGLGYFLFLHRVRASLWE